MCSTGSHSSLTLPDADSAVADSSDAEIDLIGAAGPTRPRIALRLVQRPVRLAWGHWRVGVGGASAIAASAALISSWWMPHGPLTTGHALGAIVIGASVGGVAGVAMRSRWAMLLAPVVFAAVFELATFPRRPLGIMVFVVGRHIDVS